VWRPFVELDLLLRSVVRLELLSTKRRVEGAGRRLGQGRPARNWRGGGLPAGKGGALARELADDQEDGGGGQP
jgi:hypothetical protein